MKRRRRSQRLGATGGGLATSSTSEKTKHCEVKVVDVNKANNPITTHEPQTESLDKNEAEGTVKIKKFFKHKNEDETKSSVDSQKLTRQVSNRKRVKKIDNDKSDDVVCFKVKNLPVEPVKKTLRKKALKNYCETSHISQSEKKSENNLPTESNEDKKNKNIPVYKTIRLSQEKDANKEKVYEYPQDDSQESKNAGKKRKRAVKRPAVKRAKKAENLKTLAPQKKKKSAKTKVSTAQIIPKKCSEMSLQDNRINLESIDHEAVCQNIEDTVATEVLPSIKILSDKKLEGSKRVNLMATPYIPKTISSELKLFGPKNAITSQPTSQYKKMVNHSLIRQSMSPITKVQEEFDTGSPWRPVDAFSRVEKVIQSTPQIKRPLLIRTKKLPPAVRISEKSICSADTTNISSICNEESLNIENKSAEKQNNELSPNRHFGNEISNTNSVQSESAENICKAVIKNNEKSPVKTINKENMKPILHEQTNNIANLPRPSRFEMAKTTLNSPESNTKPSESDPKQTENKKRESTKFKQTNLNSFLNLDEMPESTNISTPHGIFDDICSTPINAKKQKKLIKEPNIENAFGFDDCDTTNNPPTDENASSSNIVTMEDVEQNVKEKLFVKSKVKSALPLEISSNTVKKAILQKEAEKEKDILVKDNNKNTQNISMPNDIFDDVYSTPINSEEPKNSIKEPNVENAFGFNDFDTSDNLFAVENKSHSSIATVEDVKKSVKGKLFVKARVKSAMPLRISRSTVKKALEQSILQKKETEKNKNKLIQDKDKNIQNLKEIEENVEGNCEPLPQKKAALHAVSFSDTFDILLENGDLESKIPEEVPLFVDLEPVHFSQPPRRSYHKRKRKVTFNENEDPLYDDNDDDEKVKCKKPKLKKKKESKLSKSEQKQMHEWVKSINESFKEVEDFDLVVE